MKVFLLFEYTPTGKYLLGVFATQSMAESDKSICENAAEAYTYHIEAWEVCT